MAYRTIRYDINEKQKALFDFCDMVTCNSKNMYNVANYHIRNVMTGIKKPADRRFPNEVQVLDDVDRYIRLSNATPNKKTGKPKKQQKLPTEKKWFLGYGQLNAVFSASGNADYQSLPAHAAQNAIRKCVGAWSSYFELLKAYKKNPSGFKEKPGIPGYIKGKRMTVHISNEQAKIVGSVDGTAKLTLPGRQSFNLGKLPDNMRSLVKVEIKPYYGAFLLLVTVDDGTAGAEPEQETDVHAGVTKLLSVDLGVKNLATITDNKGGRPVVVKGGFVKARNQLYNKKTAKRVSLLMAGKPAGSKRPEDAELDRYSRDRERFFRDFGYKFAHYLCCLAVSRGARVVVIGRSRDWKASPNMGHDNNQAFVLIPFAQLEAAVTRVAPKYGLGTITREESYTSKASFHDRDPIPTYGDEGADEQEFSGKRVKRGMYVASDGTSLNADVNGSLNIGRKEFGDGLYEGMDESKLNDIIVVGFEQFYPQRTGHWKNRACTHR